MVYEKKMPVLAGIFFYDLLQIVLYQAFIMSLVKVL
jgi:hypothetical protein